MTKAKSPAAEYEKYVGKTVEITTEGYDNPGLNRTIQFFVNGAGEKYLQVYHPNKIRDMVDYTKIVSIHEVTRESA